MRPTNSNALLHTEKLACRWEISRFTQTTTASLKTMATFTWGSLKVAQRSNSQTFMIWLTNLFQLAIVMKLWKRLKKNGFICYG